MRKVMIAGNWKMNKTFSEGVELALALNEELKDGTGDVEVVVCPPAVDLKGVAEVIEQNDAPFGLGAQNVYWEEKGAFTGETAPDMLTAIGAGYCIIGHSERRGYFGETDEDINKKAKALMAHGIVPISCCGEPLEIREAGTHVGLVPYFISSHPGCTLKDMERLAHHPALKGIWMDQVQDFTPTPMTTSSVMFYSGYDPRDMKPVFTEHDMERKRQQKSFFFVNSSKKSIQGISKSKKRH